MDEMSRVEDQRVLLNKAAVVLLALSAMFSTAIGQASAQDVSEHPFIKSSDMKSETCLTCHPDKKEGKFVHTAVAKGCENCHQATSENEKTTISLVATGGELCAMCHEAVKDPVVHGPYQNGQCLTCHDPHRSEFKAQTRAETNSLCLACHAPRRMTDPEVTLVAGQTISDRDFDAIPKIGLDPTQRFGHPWATHPVAGRDDTLRKGEKMSCLSCHQPHASAQPTLIRAAADQKTDICDSCHQALENQKDEMAQADTQQKSKPVEKPLPDGKQP